MSLKDECFVDLFLEQGLRNENLSSLYLHGYRQGVHSHCGITLQVTDKSTEFFLSVDSAVQSGHSCKQKTVLNTHRDFKASAGSHVLKAAKRSIRK